MSRPIRLVAMLAALALVAAGCGRGEGVQTTAETEGLYLEIGGLTYQVEASRYMNPADVEDRDYFAGLSDSVPQPTSEETWFGVWVRVQNTGNEPLPSATVWEIHDTQDNIYRPVPLDSPFAFRPGTVAPNTVVPLPDSAPGQGPVAGSLLLFKIKTDSLQNRPLELIFGGSQGERGTYDLDV
jgi:hypothetical protein